jgi:hypothetical protein
VNRSLLPARAEEASFTIAVGIRVATDLPVAGSALFAEHRVSPPETKP